MSALSKEAFLAGRHLPVVEVAVPELGGSVWVRTMTATERDADLFGSLAAAYARHKGIEAIVFDAGLEGAASPAAAGLFQEKWAGKKFRESTPAYGPV